jgi:HK97 family phage major capsid protein
MTKEQRERMQALAVKSELTEEEIAELNKLVALAGKAELQTKALGFGDPEPKEDEDGGSDLDAKIAKLVDAKVAEIADEKPAQKGGVKAPAQKRVTQGYGDEGKDGFMYWLKTGDRGALDASLKANVNPLESTTAAQGAVAVPDDFLPEIIAKRSEASIPRSAGARVIQTSLDQLNVPVENVMNADFVITAQEAAVDEDEPTFSQVTISVYRYTKLIKATVEILGDNKANLESFLASNVGRAMAKTENSFSLVGTGSGQPQGVYVGGTAGLTFAGAAAITAAEVITLRHKLAPEYTAGAAWTTANATLGSLRGLTGNPFLFNPTPMGASGAPGSVGFLYDLPTYLSTKNAAMTTGLKSIIVGNWEFYMIAERQGLTVQRLDELYAANGYVGLLWAFRVGGAVLQAEAFQYGTQA